MRHTKLPRLQSQRLNSTGFGTYVSAKIFSRGSCLVTCVMEEGEGWDGRKLFAGFGFKEFSTRGMNNLKVIFITKSGSAMHTARRERMEVVKNNGSYVLGAYTRRSKGVRDVFVFDCVPFFSFLLL